MRCIGDFLLGSEGFEQLSSTEVAHFTKDRVLWRIYDAFLESFCRKRACYLGCPWLWWSRRVLPGCDFLPPTTIEGAFRVKTTPPCGRCGFGPESPRDETQLRSLAHTLLKRQFLAPANGFARLGCFFGGGPARLGSGVCGGPAGFSDKANTDLCVPTQNEKAHTGPLLRRLLGATTPLHATAAPNGTARRTTGQQPTHTPGAASIEAHYAPTTTTRAATESAPAL